MSQPVLLNEEIFLITDVASLKNRLLFEQLSSEISHMIHHDFERLIAILYRLDVNEEKLKALLEKNNTTDAADIMATLIIERQLEKIQSRKRTKNTGETNEERW